MASWSSWVGPTTPPGLLMRITTARTEGFSRWDLSSRTMSSTSRMLPSSSTRAGRGQRPVGHLRDVQEAVDAGLQLHEGAEVGEPHHLAGHARAHRIALGHRGPRIGLDLLEP